MPIMLDKMGLNGIDSLLSSPFIEFDLILSVQ